MQLLVMKIHAKRVGSLNIAAGYMHIMKKLIINVEYNAYSGCIYIYILAGT